MQKLTKPVDDAGDVFTQCISRTRDTELRARLISVRAAIVSAAESYEQAATAAELHLLRPHNDIDGVVTQAEMETVYTSRMAQKGAPGRNIYDKLLAAPAHGRCPLCGQRVVSTLDHHLPKARFPALAVVPSNLVPACADCNKVKLEKLPSCPEEQTLHPYFDDIGDDLWLQAEVKETSPAVVQFYVEPPREWDIVTANRVKYHFQVFGLARLYSSHAATELTDIRYRLAQLFDDTGCTGVANHLRDEAKSRAAAHRNSWQAAFYNALAASSWYCSGGFNA